MNQASAWRDDPAGYTPAGLPNEVTMFDGPLRGGLGVGKAGKVGLLDLGLAPWGGTTRVQRQFQRAPLYIYRPIYLDPGRPDMAFIYIQQSGDGLVQGDRYRIDIDCAPRSAVHITTQASTKVFTCHENFATQLITLRAGAGAVVEYLPDPVVPYRGSRFFQRTSITVDPDATVIFGETLLPGRVAHGEAHVYELYWAETDVRRPDGALLFADVLRFAPADGRGPKSIGLLGRYDVVATLYVVTNRIEPAAMVSLLRQSLSERQDALVGVSELPNGCGTAARLLGATSRAVRAASTTAWNAARFALLGARAPNLRKG